MLCYEVAETDLRCVSYLIRDCMVNVWPGLRVPLAIKLECGKDWGSMELYDPDDSSAVGVN